MKESVERRLPLFSATTHKETGEMVLIRRGQKGYFPPTGKWFHENKVTADEFNDEKGITKPQAEAMLIGSMFGFNAPGVEKTLDGL